MEYFKVFDNLITPRLTMRAEGDNATYENCFFELPDAGAKTLEDYYDDMDGADNPFSAITIKGTKGKQWKWTANGNLRLNHNNINILGNKSGAAQLKVKSGYAVKLRITVGEEDFIIGKRKNRPEVRLDGDDTKGIIWKNLLTGSTTDRYIEYSWPIEAYDRFSCPYGKEQS